MYRQIKHFPETEPYCRASLSVGVWRVLTRLRAGCLPLQIELGHYTSRKKPLNMRICKLCNDGTEDQEHFLFHCRALTEPRNDFFCRVQTLNPDSLSYTLLNKCQHLLCPQQHIHCIAHGIYSVYILLDKTYCTAFYKVLHCQLSHLMMLVKKKKNNSNTYFLLLL